MNEAYLTSTMETPGLRVGVNGSGYVIERLITSLPFGRAQIVRTYDLLNIWNFTQRFLFPRTPGTAFANCFHCDLGLNRVRLLHLVNTISCSPTPWIVSYEHYLPRWNVSSDFGLRLLAKTACRRVIAISQYALDEMNESLRHSPYRDAILSKTIRINPPQPLLVRSAREKAVLPGPVTFAFVGRDFFRKGGLEVLHAFARLKQERRQFHLHLVTTFGYGDYASRSTSDHLRKARKAIETLGDRVSVHRHIPNPAVLNLLRRSHVGLLPTYDDTYGFSVLESQAAGCPVITTDVCVMSEINDPRIGWVIPIPQTERKVALRSTDQHLRNISAAIEEGVYAAASEAIRNPSLVVAKADGALDRISREHDPLSIMRRTEEVYFEALA
ncbi:MAG: glycosyltransferase family 4 protein [Bacteroidetes bacterium]|nr:glycosyltransferase family 4 protein [Bacteroidota bacterium]